MQEGLGAIDANQTGPMEGTAVISHDASPSETCPDTKASLERLRLT